MADRTVSAWTVMPCDDCGMEYQATRTRSCTAERFICEPCEVAERSVAHERERLALALRGHLADSICDDIASGVFGRTGGAK